MINEFMIDKINADRTAYKYVIYCQRPNGKFFSKVCESDIDMVTALISYLVEGIVIVSIISNGVGFSFHERVLLLEIERLKAMLRVARGYITTVHGEIGARDLQEINKYLGDT